MRHTKEELDECLEKLSRSRLTHWEWILTLKCRKELKEHGEISEYDEVTLERIYADRVED